MKKVNKIPKKIPQELNYQTQFTILMKIIYQKNQIIIILIKDQKVQETNPLKIL